MTTAKRIERDLIRSMESDQEGFRNSDMNDGFKLIVIRWKQRPAVEMRAASIHLRRDEEPVPKTALEYPDNLTQSENPVGGGGKHD